MVGFLANFMNNKIITPNNKSFCLSLMKLTPGRGQVKVSFFHCTTQFSANSLQAQRLGNG